MTAQPENIRDWFVAEDALIPTDDDYDFMSKVRSYDPDDEIARQHRVRFRQALPFELSTDEVTELGSRIHAIASHRAGELGQSDEKRVGLKAENRFLQWLGRSATSQDDHTLESVKTVLWHGHGVSGKLTAVSLAVQKIVQY
jgi:hypothetical protein